MLRASRSQPSVGDGTAQDARATTRKNRKRMTGGNGGFPASAPPHLTLSGAEPEVCNTEVLSTPNDVQREPSNPLGWERLLAQLPSPLEARTRGSFQ